MTFQPDGERYRVPTPADVARMLGEIPPRDGDTEQAS